MRTVYILHPYYTHTIYLLYTLYRKSDRIVSFLNKNRFFLFLVCQCVYGHVYRADCANPSKLLGIVWDDVLELSKARKVVGRGRGELHQCSFSTICQFTLQFSTCCWVPRKTPTLFIVKQLAGDIRNNHVFTMYGEEFV